MTITPTIANEILAYVFIISLLFFILYGADYIKKQRGKIVHRIMWSAIFVIAIICHIIACSYGWAIGLSLYMVLCYYRDYRDNKHRMSLYKLYILDLHRIINAGRGETWTANHLRTMAFNCIQELPKKKQAELREWELNLENNNA
jgi:hypothetical protein